MNKQVSEWKSFKNDVELYDAINFISKYCKSMYLGDPDACDNCVLSKEHAENGCYCCVSGGHGYSSIHGLCVREKDYQNGIAYMYNSNRGMYIEVATEVRAKMADITACRGMTWGGEFDYEWGDVMDDDELYSALYYIANNCTDYYKECDDCPLYHKADGYKYDCNLCCHDGCGNIGSKIQGDKEVGKPYNREGNAYREQPTMYINNRDVYIELAAKMKGE